MGTVRRNRWQIYKTISIISSLFLLIACQQKSDTAQLSAKNSLSASRATSTSSVSKTAFSDKAVDNTLTVYTSQLPTNLAPIFAEYKQKTGISINVVTAAPEALLARLKTEDKNTPADLLLTQDVGVFAQAKQAGLIQPFSDEKLNETLPERFRDKSGEWAGMGYYARTVVYDSRVVKANDISSYSDLAKPKWSHKLCLTSSTQVANQSLIVNLLQMLGDKKTQAILQGWVSNLAIPPLADDKALLQAIASGQCQIGLVNSDEYGNYVEKNPDIPVKLTWINKGYGGVHTNVAWAAIPKFAKHPDLTLALIEWLSSKDTQSNYASLNKLYPTHKSAETSVLLHSWGSFEPSGVAVSLYGDKQKEALEQIKLANYP